MMLAKQWKYVSEIEKNHHFPISMFQIRFFPARGMRTKFYDRAIGNPPYEIIFIDDSVLWLKRCYRQPKDAEQSCGSWLAFLSALNVRIADADVNAMANAKMKDAPCTENTPGGQFSKTFEIFLEAQKENPEAKYRTQLTKMRHTGFT